MKINPTLIVFGMLIFSIIGFRLIAALRVKKAAFKGMRRYNSILILVSLVFIYIAYRYLKGYFAFDPTNPEMAGFDPTVYILNTILWLMIAAFWVLKGTDRDYINDSGICCQEGSYTWDRIKDFKWSQKQSNETRKGIKRYYVISFITKERPSKVKFLGSKSRAVSMKISADDRKKVDAFVKQKVRR